MWIGPAHSWEHRRFRGAVLMHDDDDDDDDDYGYDDDDGYDDKDDDDDGNDDDDDDDHYDDYDNDKKNTLSLMLRSYRVWRKVQEVQFVSMPHSTEFLCMSVGDK